MRAILALTIFALGFALNGAASAADFSGEHAMHASHGAARAPYLLVTNNEPGVSTRAYWSRPWQNRHYFPFTGTRPKVGRHENLNARRAPLPPAESFYREWSTLSLYPPEPVVEQVVNEQPPLK